MNEKKLIVGAAIAAVVLILLAGFIVSEQNKPSDIKGNYVLAEGTTAYFGEDGSVSYNESIEMNFSINEFDGKNVVASWNSNKLVGQYCGGYITFACIYDGTLGTNIEEVKAVIDSNKLTLSAMKISDRGLSSATSAVLYKEGSEFVKTEQPQYMKVGDVYNTFTSKTTIDGEAYDGLIKSYSMTASDWKGGIYVIDHELVLDDGTECYYRSLAVNTDVGCIMSGIDSVYGISYIQVSGERASASYSYIYNDKAVNTTCYMTSGDPWTLEDVSVLSGLMYKGKCTVILNSGEKYASDVTISFGDAVGNTYTILGEEYSRAYIEYYSITPTNQHDGYLICGNRDVTNGSVDGVQFSSGYITKDLKWMVIQFCTIYYDGSFDTSMHVMRLVSA